MGDFLEEVQRKGDPVKEGADVLLKQIVNRPGFTGDSNS